MKILLATPYFYPSSGGLERYTYHIARGLVEGYGDSVVVVTATRDRSECGVTVSEGIRIYRLYADLVFSNSPLSLSWFKNVLHILQKEQPDIVNGHAPVPFMNDIVGLCIGKIPYVITYHFSSMKKGKLPLDWAIELYESTLLRLLFMKSDAVICYSNELTENKMRKYRSKFKPLTPGVDCTFFCPPKKENRSPVVLFVGKIDTGAHFKGIDILMQAFALARKSIPGIKLRLVGGGNAHNIYRALADTLGLSSNVTISGALYGEELRAAYQDASVLVLPTHTVQESFGMVLLEAMACKLPVIGSYCGGIPRIIQHNKNGILVSPRNIEMLAQAIVKTLVDKPSTNRRVLQAYADVTQKFTWQAEVEKTHSLFSTLVKEASKKKSGWAKSW
ncbi:MAG: glycosyltransferase family 4 protein [Patescibacteria group bacterium]|nr:glycosyltransferase family 4 protein [Patescibacteria group bacterium]